MISFEHITPEEAGISSDCILCFLNRLEAKQVPMHSIQLIWQDRIITEGYYHPYTATTPHRMFSISKSFVSIAIGLLEQEGRLSLSDPIVKYFPDMVPENVHPWIQQMTIRDMLMMRTCHASTTYKINMTKNWVESFFITPPTHPSGQIFHYDTSSAHTLCALAERLTGMPLLDYLKNRLPELELSESSYMLTDPFGTSLGGSGLVCTPEDLRKFAYFIEHQGNVDGKQVLNAAYIKTATSNLTSTRMTAPLPSEACGYGYQFWQNERGGYTCYGMGGQLIIFLPEYDFICITTADTQGLAGGNQLIYDALYEEILPYMKKTVSESDVSETFSADSATKTGLTDTEENDTGYALLQNRLQSLQLRPLKSTKNSCAPADMQSFSGTWQFTDNAQNFSDMTLDFQENSCGNPLVKLSFTIQGTPCQLEAGFGTLCCGVFPSYQQKYAASAVWEDESTLYLRFHIIDEYAGSVHIQLHFASNQVTVFLKKQEESLFQEFHGHLTGTRIS